MATEENPEDISKFVFPEEVLSLSKKPPPFFESIIKRISPLGNIANICSEAELFLLFYGWHI